MAVHTQGGVHDVQDVTAPQQKLSEQPCATPNPGFLCPLTGIVMRDPVVLEATLISFERIAILWWLSVNPDICPVTGRPVAECAVRNDEELRVAIEEWAARCAPHLVVRAVLCCAVL